MYKIRLYIKQFKVIFTDKNEKKNIFRIIKEFISASIKKREIAYHYPAKYLYRKEITNYQDYLSFGEFMKMYNSKELHRYEHVSILKNKLSFALLVEKNNLNCPELISYNLRDNFCYAGKRFKIKDTEALYNMFKEVMNSSQQEKLFVKPLSKNGGKGCHLITLATLKEDLKAFDPDFLNQGAIHQAVVQQHESINAIYPHSINTIRFETYIDKLGKTHVLSGFMRFGAGGKVVDNAGSGGMYVSINMENGKLRAKSHQSMHAGGHSLKAHPDTGFVYDGFQIPYFHEAVELVLDAVNFIPDRIIGWDIGITPEGPTIIEANHSPSIKMSDIAYGGYLQHPLYAEILDEA
ncbi:MAG: sugar-transfer associated ATP-grasp domain-containing protein [Leeuwenhoekiella sp.]